MTLIPQSKRKPPRCWCGHLADGYVYGVPMCKGCMEADR